MDEPDEQKKSDEQKKLESKLGLNSIEDLSVDQIPQFLQEIPSMSMESVKAIVAILPDFQNLVASSLDHIQSGTNSVLKANWKSQKRVHAGFQDYRRMIDRELEREHLDPDAKYHLLNLVMKANEAEREMNAEHQTFALATVKTVAAAGAALGVVVIVSVAALISNGSDDKA